MIMKIVKNLVAPVDVVIKIFTGIEDYLWTRLIIWECENKGEYVKYKPNHNEDAYYGYWYKGWLSTPQFLICLPKNCITKA